MSNTAKHPKGLYFLFFTEMWERFGYYLMLGIFSLYMLDSAANGGMGFSPAQKSDVYGTYIGLVYLTPFLGGLLADRILGYRKSILIGGLMMAAGYIGLALPGITMFYVSLLLIIVGNGFFKPNISTLVGNLYNNDQYRMNKDAGFNIFYMGINVGAFICNFVAAFMRINYGWGYAFAAAGVGMLIGLVIFFSGTKHIKDADVIKPLHEGDLSTGKILATVLLPMFIFGVLGYLIPGNIFGTDTNDAFLFGCLPVISFFIYLFVKANKDDKGPIGALLAVYACIVIFWAVFHQNGDALTVWAEEYTNREMPASVGTAADKVGMAQIVVHSDAVDFEEARFKTYIDSLVVQKDSLSKIKDMVGVKKVAETIALEEHSRKYFANLPVSQIPPNGQNLKLFSAELYQSINPFWVVLLTPIVVGFWGLLRNKKREPSTPTKIAIGLVITALSALVMVAAVKTTDIGADKASSFWLIATYGVITVGELCLSPMGLSLVSKLSPPRITALMMGGFFLSTSVGNKLSGVMSGLWEKYDDKSNFFLTNFFLVMFAAVVMFILLRWLNRVMREKNLF
ncbi:MAG TPA: peptide MFS transporter [Flavobacteriales bacterium]|nr:peptide MFS transporter [Flavobacteriales bacterium]